MAITLYTWPHSSGTKVHWALEELGLPYELRPVDRAAREHKGAAYRAIQPNGKVPALVDGDETYFESAAILIHLGERHGIERGLWPAAGRARADALCWTVWSQTELNVYAMQYVYHGLDSPVSYAPDQRSRATAEYNRANAEEHLDMIEARLAGREHLLDGFTLVDVAAADVLRVARGFGVDLGARPALVAWLDRCVARPALARVLA